MSIERKETLDLNRIIVVSILLLFITANLAIAELTKQDLKEIEALLDKQEKRIIETVNSRIDAVEKTVNSRIDAVEKAVNSRIDAVKEGQESLKWMIGILALLVVGGIALPPIWQERRERKASQNVVKLEQNVAGSLEKHYSLIQNVNMQLDSLNQRVAQLEPKVADFWANQKIRQHFNQPRRRASAA